MNKLNEINKVDDSRAKAILNDVIQIAAEDTKLTCNMDVYEHEILPENNTEEISGTLRMKIEDMIKSAEERVKSRG